MCISEGGCWYLKYKTRARCLSLRLKSSYSMILGMKMPVGIFYGAKESGGIGGMVREVRDPKRSCEAEVYTQIGMRM